MYATRPNDRDGSHLHSTLVRFYGNRAIFEEDEYFNLHSTLVRFYVNIGGHKGMLRMHLHSTLVRFYEDIPAGDKRQG